MCVWGGGGAVMKGDGEGGRGKGQWEERDKKGDKRESREY